MSESTFSKSFAGLLLLATTAFAQTPPPPAGAAPVGSHAAEDTVAAAFVKARAAAHLRRLSRITDRTALRQIVCTSAATGTARLDLLHGESEADGALLQLNPDSLGTGASLPADLRRVAEYDDRSSAHGRRITRFSVAAFAVPATNGEAAPEPWVGVALYWSRATEYFAIHLTRSYYPQNLQPSIAPACRGVR